MGPGEAAVLRRGLFFRCRRDAAICLFPGNQLFVETGNFVVEWRLNQLMRAFASPVLLAMPELHHRIVLVAPADHFEFRPRLWAKGRLHHRAGQLHNRHRAGISEADVGNLRLEIAYRFPPAVRVTDKRVVLPCSRIDQSQVASVPPRISGRTVKATLPRRLILMVLGI